MKLRGKNVLVTGGARRIGRAICESLADYGANVAVHFRSSGEEAAVLCGELVGRGVKACSIQADLSSEPDCRRLVERAAASLNGLDALINNAGIFLRDDITTLQAAQAQEQWQVNLLAPLLLIREFVKVADGGSIVNLLDQRTAQPDSGHLSYWISKKALEEATGSLALELAPEFRVNGVAPGAVLPPERKGNAGKRETAGPQPLKRVCTPLEVAQAVIFLLSSDAITGEIIRVDGGQHLVAQREEQR